MSHRSTHLRRAGAATSLFVLDPSGTVCKTRLHFAPGVLENAPDQVRLLLENLPRLKAYLSQIDLSQSAWETRRGFFFRHLKGPRRTGSLCMFPDCENVAIPRSHAISRNGPLRLVAESGHVMSPRINARTGNIVIQKVGIGRASTFPGFCRKHELIFGRFERTNDWKTTESWSAQFFRTACWELRTIDEGIAALRRVGDAYRARISKEAMTFLGIDHLTIATRSVDHQQRVLEHNINALVKYRARLKRELFVPLKNDLVDGGSRMEGIVVHMKPVVPLCLAGTGTFTWQTLSNRRRTNVLALIQVLPAQDGTRIGMVAAAQKYHCLHGYLAASIRRVGGLATMLQTWMLRGAAEQWFLRPSIWNSLPEATRTAIQTDRHGSYDLADTCDYGLFAGIDAEI